MMPLEREALFQIIAGSLWHRSIIVGPDKRYHSAKGVGFDYGFATI
jgi:hypothetical protein